MLDKFHDECGVVGVYGHPDAANLAYLGLYALQHRGQESAGIVASNNGKMHLEVGMGLVADVFSDARLKKLPGHLAIGHNRYSTTGVSRIKNAQPCLIEYARWNHGHGPQRKPGQRSEIRKELGSGGAIFPIYE